MKNNEYKRTAWDSYYMSLGKPTDYYGIGDMSRKEVHMLELKLKWASRVAVTVAVASVVMLALTFVGSI